MSIFLIFVFRLSSGKFFVLVVKLLRGILVIFFIFRFRDGNLVCVDFGGGGLVGIGWLDYMFRFIFGVWGFCCFVYGFFGVGVMLIRKIYRNIVLYIKDLYIVSYLCYI